MSQNVNQYEEERECLTLKNQGQKIFCIFHKPKGIKNYPAILFCHGLGGHKVGRYRVYVELASTLAAKGIATLRMDFRGSGDSEGAFEEMTLDSEVSDACEGLSFLESYKDIDPQRIALFGRSMGSCVSIMAANKYQKVKSICLWAPIYNADDWQDKWKRLHTKDLDQNHKQKLMTIEGQVPGYEFYKQLFSMNLDDDIAKLSQTPLMIIHGNQDNMVKSDHSEQFLKNRLHATGKTKFIQLPNSDHHFSNLEERKIALSETCTWYEETL